MDAPSPDTRSHIRRAFAFRAGYLALAWLACLAFHDPEATGVFASVITLAVWAIPIAAPLILWLDWRWLSAHADEVNRFGLKRRR